MSIVACWLSCHQETVLNCDRFDSLAAPQASALAGSISRRWRVAAMRQEVRGEGASRLGAGGGGEGGERERKEGEQVGVANI